MQHWNNGLSVNVPIYCIFFFFFYLYTLIAVHNIMWKHSVLHCIYIKSLITFQDSYLGLTCFREVCACGTGDRIQKLPPLHPPPSKNIAHLHFDECMINKHVSNTSEYTRYLNLCWCMFNNSSSLFLDYENGRIV